MTGRARRIDRGVGQHEDLYALEVKSIRARSFGPAEGGLELKL